MKGVRDEIDEYRDMNYNIDPIFLNRWSPRAMSGEMLDRNEYMALFEAARWAPSSYNNQHWRFLYETKDSENWDLFFNLLGDWNQKWAKNASVLVCLISKTTFDYNGEEARTHSFGTGAAWENLALEAARRDLVAHAMQGFDYDEAREVLDVPEEYEVECMIAIGRKGSVEVLPEDMREDEHPNQRKDLNQIVEKGSFPDRDNF